ncbi:MAG: hypothetical protein AMXMBFR13_07350 [Phycisphaerae bacterium]
MAQEELPPTILIVTGATIRAEEMDRPLAYRLAEEVRSRLSSDSAWRVLVISDVLYLNDKDLQRCPLIAIGGPGVNSLSGALYRELSSVLAVENVLIIQMDADLQDLRCCLWGMNHEQTVEALDLFCGRGYLDHFLVGVRAGNISS